MEHFRPKAGVTDEPAHWGYWWLAYEWSNLYFSCKSCNQEHKKNYFPLLEGGIRAAGPNDPLDAENPALLDPARDAPEECLSYDWVAGRGIYVTIRGSDVDRRGEFTWTILGLNRDEVARERADLLPQFHAIDKLMKVAQHFNWKTHIKKAAADIARVTSARHRHAGFARFFFRAMGLNEYVSDD